MANLNGSNTPVLDRYSNGIWVIRYSGKRGGNPAPRSKQLGTTNEERARKLFADWLSKNGYDKDLANAPAAVSKKEQEAIREKRRIQQRRSYERRKQQEGSRNLPAVIEQDEDEEEVSEAVLRRREYQRERRARQKAERNGSGASGGGGKAAFDLEMIEAAMGCLSSAMQSQAQAMKMLQVALKKRS